MKMGRLIFLSLVLTSSWQARAQDYDTNNVMVQTFAGSGFYGYYDGQGVLTMFNQPAAIVADTFSNLFVLDRNNGLIRKITPGAAVSTFVSISTFPIGGTMTIDSSNNLWVIPSPYSYGSLLRISPDGTIFPIGLPYPSFSMNGLCFDSANNLYFSDGYSNKIYRFKSATGWEVFVGSGNLGSVDGNWIFTSFNGPRALAADAADNIYVWDSGGHVIRRILPNRDVQTIAGQLQNYYSSDVDGVGTNASFNVINDMRMDAAGNLILACGTSVRRISPSTNVTTIAGSFNQNGYTNGPGALARFRNASGLCFAQGLIFVADADDQRIRSISRNAQAEPIADANLTLNLYAGLTITGMVGRSYRVESSTNLSTWVTESTLYLNSSPQLWIDPSNVCQKKFYRALLLP